jgi:hypothetical protein
MDNETIFLKREELYKLVWSEPVSKLAHGMDCLIVVWGKSARGWKYPCPAEDIGR